MRYFYKILGVRPAFRGDMGRHMPRGVKFQGWQNILAKLILKMMYLMKKKNSMFYYIIIC
jgi:hypothetical protein